MDDLRSAPLPPLGPADRVRGPAGAPCAIVYIDYSCPVCAAAHDALRAAALRVAYRPFALAARHARAVPLACACEAAALQGHFWEFADSLFADPGHIDDPHLWERVRTLGLDLDRFERDRRSAEVAATVAAAVRAAIRGGVAVAPTVVAGEERIQGAPAAEALDRLASR